MSGKSPAKSKSNMSIRMYPYRCIAIKYVCMYVWGGGGERVI